MTQQWTGDLQPGDVFTIEADYERSGPMRYYRVLGEPSEHEGVLSLAVDGPFFDEACTVRDEPDLPAEARQA